MLQQNAIPPAVLELLKKISAIKQLDDFGLGGGTNIALRFGHRLSVDLDFFTNTGFENSSVFNLITKSFPASELLFEKDQTMLFSINDIKVDFVLYPFPWAQPFDVIDNTRFLSIQDIIPMKLQAASNRNAKKDYWDIATLMDKYSLAEMLNIFKQKFPQIDTAFIIHSLTDFEKADTELNPDTFKNITWEEIKLKLIDAVRKYTEGFL
ncbi:MAG TPA: nucleotidyl transferase AbiEii/AbiGii toxin family protein [Chitinophagaceae bacterium]|nr:nucleotidyl transferase AbiEii/AbiGii toxin family protein [Chitinophagaceae bacterium]